MVGLSFELLRWSFHKFGMRTVLNLALLLVASACVVLTMQESVRGFDRELALMVVAAALIVGWVVARSPFPAWLASLVFLVMGLELLFWRVGNLGTSSLLLANRIVVLASGAFWRPFAFPDPQPAMHAAMQFSNDLTTVCLRVWDWLQGIFRGERLADPVASTFAWNLAIWLLTGWSAWAVRRRRQPLEGLLPGMAVLCILLAYARSDILPLLFLVGSGIILLIIAGYDVNERRWIGAGTERAEDIPNDLAMLAVPLAFVIVISAALTPSVSIPEIVQLVQKRAVFQSESGTLPESLGLLPQPPARTVFDSVRWPGMPRDHLIGSGPELSRQVVMTIRTGDLYPHMPADLPVPALYWRGITYDRYLGRGWSMTSSWTDAHPAGDVELPAASKGERRIDEEVQIVGDSDGLLYTAGSPIRIDHDFTIAWRSPEDFAALSVGASTYHVQAMISNAGEQQLVGAGSNYPDWVRERYLDLPDNVPQRVLNLARDLTATARTPYDRARAIESYLRTIPYSLDVGRPPAGRDVVDYFLFDLKKGYCDYFASAMVVLARAAGLPARLVVGYAPGRLDPENGRYVITRADGHSWTEVYFPGYGWIEFEPTSSRASIGREHETILPTANGPEIGSPFAGLLLRARDGYMGILAIPFALSLVAAGWALTDSWRLERLSPGSALDRIYLRLCRSAMRLGICVRACDTPNEVASLFDLNMSNLFRGSSARLDMTRASAEFRSITLLYVKSRYSDHSLSTEDREEAIRHWERLRRRLWLVWLVSIRQRRRLG